VEPIPDNGSYPGLIPRDRLEHLLEVLTTNFAAPGFVVDKRLPMHEALGLGGQPASPHTPPLQQLWIERQWWLGWVEFHPTSEVYQATI
jgi:hypothetical protein